MDVGVFLTELIDAKAATAGAIADLELRKKEKLEKLLAYEDKVASVEHAKVQFEHVPVRCRDALSVVGPGFQCRGLSDECSANRRTTTTVCL
jgi:hypothetical protein